MRKFEKNKTNPQKTVLVICIGFLVIYYFSDIAAFFYASIVIGVLGILSRRLAKMIEFLWMKLAKVLSYIVPNILLSLIFFVILVPVAFLSRIFASNSSIQLKNNTKSLFIAHDREIDKEYFEKPW